MDVQEAELGGNAWIGLAQDRNRWWGACDCGTEPSGSVIRHVHIIATLHVTRHNTPIHNILSTDLKLSISQKALGTLPEDGNVMPKHVGATIHINKLNE
jgi:hypothetical protein